MPKKPLRLAVVSCGAIAQAHLRGIAACRDGEVLAEGGPDPFAEQMREFVSAVLEGREPGNSGRDVLPSLAVIDAAYKSVEERRAVELRQDEGGRWEIQ
ncbi:MAG: hypothetical protein A3F84_23210 [Candidatus Handelsmanbacteria bacterium RIFCSPLOWO2_12_FULL_64_10]|uniref:Gfo/Idh/MocA-like oxidoreductase C-terminal domain-containing protein n=1 Tax=Handelsmanbacteria sp. (strain RIFCSPLOWO2_12_FULL_64_10) TaxID=1817868 RepID=A0A1F6CKK9_HANXR|nr:MAG: hypothetical protein A3F84_23210 [Candidatus Handelsmanbacteria bacterium RIFCSPLOWO2_12_FULL_64_10]